MAWGIGGSRGTRLMKENKHNVPESSGHKAGIIKRHISTSEQT